MFEFIKDVIGFGVTLATMGFGRFARNKSMFPRVAITLFGFGVAMLLMGVNGIMFNLMFTGTILTVAFGISVIKRGFGAACERFAGIVKSSSSF